ncbi:MAG TPA: methyltransferase, partial [Polyangiaceae bacterium]|nr:methyltransferase [Polyangiaceae bacterium]
LGAEEYAVMRRLELPRSMLGRLVECVVVLDRAAYLEEADYAVEVGVLVPRGITPRNLAIIARA